MKSFSNPDFASRSRDKARPKIGVVLGSGGIKALASIPLFDFLYEAGIDIDLLVGCSGGGVIASLRGAGYDTDQMRKFAYDIWVRELFTKVDYRSALAIPNLPFGRFDQSSGILKTEGIHGALQHMFGERRFEERVTEPPDSFLGYFMRSLGFNVRWLLRNQLALSIDLHHHEIIMINVVFNKMISLREVNEIPMILELGAKAVAAEKDEILAAIKNFSIEKIPTTEAQYA